MFEPPRPSTTRRKTILLWVLGLPLASCLAVVAFAALLAVDHGLHPNLQVGPRRAVPAPASLHVEAARGPLGLAVTNREPRDLTTCDATVAGDDRLAWMASWKRGLPARIRPLETARVRWDDFQMDGKPMAASVGLAGRITLTCLVEGEHDARSVRLGP